MTLQERLDFLGKDHVLADVLVLIHDGIYWLEGASLDAQYE